MSKEKIMKLKTNNKAKFAVALLAMLLVLAIVSITVYATNSDEYAVEVKDDGSSNRAEDSNSRFTKKIVEDTTTSVTYEVKVNNLADSTRIPEVAIVIDSSRSVATNDLTGNVKTKAIQLVTELLTHSPRTKISISTNSNVITGMSNSNLATYTNAINGITFTDGQSVANGIDKANSSFSSADTEKYLVIFSDATDSTKDKIEALTSNNIEVFSMLTDITNNEYQTSTGSMGTVYMLSDISNFSMIYNKTNVSMLNVKLTDTFSNEANKYFDFEILSKEDDVEIEKTDTGYILKCAAIKVGESRTLKYKLTLKDINVDTGDTYEVLNSSNDITIEYEDPDNQAQTYKMTNSPTFVICKKYSLTIKAVSEKSKNLPVENLDVKVVGTIVTGQDLAGNDIIETIFDDTLTTDSKGEILIDGLKTLGDITFEIKPLVNQFGYSDTSATQIIVHNDPQGVGTIWAEADVGEEPETDPVERNVTVYLPISVQTFDMTIITTELNNTNVALGNIEYRLIQPKLNSLYEMEAIYGVTDPDGKLTLKPAIMTKDGSYQYILSQMTTLDGYDSMGNVTLIVTFENGIVTNIDHKYNDLVTTDEVIDDSNKTIVRIGNAALKDSTFILEINLEDKDTSTKLFGGVYDIELTRVTGAGEQITSTYNGYITDMEGKISVEMPASGQYMSLKITEREPKAGYIADPVVKEITFSRNNGIVQNISSKNPPTIDAIADSDNNTIVVNLTSELASEQNRIQIHLADNDEPDANIPGVLLGINKVGETDMIQAITNRDGIANFIVPNEGKGTYDYEIHLLSIAPSGYLAPSTQLGVVRVEYNEQTFIKGGTVASSTTPYADVAFEQMIEELYKFDTAKVEIRLEPDPASAYKLRINLLDGKDVTTIANQKGLAGGKYSILMESDGVEVKYLAGKLTDTDGNYTTRIVGGGQEIKITITQTATVQGYILTKTTEVIELELTDNGYELANKVNVYDPANGQYRGPELVGKELIYHDINESKSGAHTVLNLFVNKKDQNDFLVSGVKVRLSSDTLKDANDKPLDYLYDATDDLGRPIQKDYQMTDQNGYFEVLGIKVQGDKLNNGERVDYLTMEELDADGNVKPNTKIIFKITFRLNDNTGVIEGTNVEATWGNRLVISKTYSSRETDVAYESDVHLDLFTNFDDVGNFALDLKKVNKDGKTLPGAKYDVVVMRPDGTNLVRRDITVGDHVELDGVLVSQGTKIEITEKEAPIGYLVNEYTEIIEIESIDTVTGVVKCKLEPSSYPTPRAVISSEQPIVGSDGSYKLCVTLDVTDYEMDTFKFGIIAQDGATSSPLKDYSFNITTSEGAQKNTPVTDVDGKTMAQVGANYKTEGYEVTYKVDTLKAADYYKRLAEPIEIKVVFDLNGDVSSAATLTANQTMPGYGTIWEIKATNTIDGNDIDVLIKIDPCDPLVVNIQTVDTITNQDVTHIEYAITPTINLPAAGTTKLEVGYVLPGGMQTYTIEQTNKETAINYQAMPDQQIRVTYDKEGNVEILEMLTDKVHEVSVNGKEITIKIDAEPSVPFVVTNTAYFGGSPIANGKFEISTSEEDVGRIKTDVNGKGITYAGEFGNDTTSKIFTVKQTEAGYGYATVEDFQIEVFFDANRTITDAKIVGDVNKYVQFVDVTYKVPSVAGDEGYNGNDKGIINISVKNYPDVQFKIENVDRRDDTIKLEGTTYKVVSSINTKDEQIMTDENGIGIANLDKSGYETTVTYTITEVSPASRHQTLTIDAVLEVDFNNLGYIIGTPRVIKRADVVTATIPTILNPEDNFRINLVIKNNPELALTITKVDQDDPTILIPKVDFELTARIVKDNLGEYSEEEIEKLTLNSAELTEESYLSQVIDRLKIDREDVEQIKTDIALEELITELREDGNLTDEEEDEIRAQVNNNLKINKIASLEKATKTQINRRIAAVTNRAVIDRLLEEGKTTEDRVNELLEIVKDLVRLDVDNVTTDQNGIAVAYMDKTLANKTIEYTLRETRKADGYDWLDEVVIFEITYDGTGRMVGDSPVKPISGEIEITNVDQYNFAVSVTVKNKPSDELRIHLSVEDVYDSEKKLETATFDAYLVDTSTTVSFRPDDKYRVMLESGSDIGGTGLTTAHGEDTESMGIYEEGAGGRILRLVLKQTPTSYYIGDEKYDSAYQALQYALLVNVHFDDEGKITGTSLYNPGGDSNSIGYIADERYIQVSHTRNTVNVTVRFYPMLQVQMQAVDKYTGESLAGKFTIDTRMWGHGTTSSSEIVSAGYINPHFSSYYGHSYYGKTYSAVYNTSNTITSIEEANRLAIAPTEADFFAENKNPNKGDIRTFYIYENEEPIDPMQYQTYLPRHITHSSQYLLAKVQVKYDDLGQVENVEILQVNSSNNIENGFFTTVKATVNEHTIQIVVEYAPITTINAIVIDEVSGAGLSGIRINPYVDGNYVTRTSYEYRTTLYYTTGNSGKTAWTYWGASVPDTLNRYVLDTYTMGSGYDGYFDPNNIILDVSYGDDGRIKDVTPRNTDQFGDVNAQVTWDQYNHISVTIKYCRKFNVQLYKVDYNDSNKQLNAAFDIVTSEGTRVSMAANTVTTVGKIYAGKTVKYTLSEETVPNGYIPLENLDILVEFNNNGSIRSATSTSDYYEFLSSAPVDPTTNSLRKVDLTANIKNKPRFDVNIELSDEFYPAVKLEGGTFTIESSKGEVSSGGIATDKNGILETYVGTVYPNEDVVYTVKQTNVIPGYYENNTIVKFKVHFNANGKVESYTLTDGTDVASMHPTKHVGQQEVQLNITNRPKDVKLGIEKYDEVTNEVMGNIGFTLKIEEDGKVPTEKNVITNADGTAVEVVDEFKEQTGFRTVVYTVSEIEAAVSYRKIQDVVIRVTYREDGSMYLYDVLSNPSEIAVEVAVNKTIYYVETETEKIPVHIKLRIPNDNAYDLIVKDEDKNYAGLGIEGTVYDVSINGEVKDPITTDANGIALLKNQTQTGEIEISITERTIGEGYRADNNNTVTFKVAKGTEIYSLDFVDGSNSNPTYAVIDVNEEFGTVTVTFKNETKLELTVQKDDINTGEVLEDAVFEIKQEELDSSGNVIVGTEKVITTDANNTTDANGLLYFDLGLSHQNKTIRYIFTETTPPDGYTQILPITVTVQFDAYGHIQNITDDSFRAEETLTSNTGKSHHMIVIIGNGTVNEAYTVKIVTEDSQSFRRINGSIFQVEAIETLTGATNKSITGATKNTTSNIAGNVTIFERGALKVTGVTAEGEVDIKFRQIETATGYVYGSNQTSGTVKIKTEFNITSSSQEKEVTISPVDNGGFDVSIDNINREITIKVLNDPQVTFEITKIDGDTEKPIEGIKFNITSAKVISGGSTPTGFSQDAKLTDKKGYTEANAGYSYDGQTVLYTISEEKLLEYQKLEDILLLVQYDTNGNIAEYQVIGNKDAITIKEDDEKRISKRVLSEDDDLIGVVEIDYKDITIPTGIGSRILQMEIKNYKEPSDYRIQIGKYHEDTTYPYLIPGAKYQITVTQEYGKAITTWTDITDENGVITSPYFSGHGMIEVAITELEAPEGFKLDEVTKTTRMMRYESSGKIVIHSTDSGAKIKDNDYSMVYLEPVDEVLPGLYDIIINKVDSKTGSLIAENPAEIKLELLEEYETITQTVNPETGEITETVETNTIRTPVVEEATDDFGRLVVSKLKAPNIPGEYTYVLSETKAPNNYEPIEENEVQIVVTFDTNSDQEMVIKDVIVKDAIDVKAGKNSDQVMSILVYNSSEDEGSATLDEDEFGIDLRKVDSDLYQITTGTAEFELLNTQTREITPITTDELGRAELVKFKIPEEAGNYKYTLKETKAPKGYKLSEGDIDILLEFKEDEETGEIYLLNSTVLGSNVVYANKPEDGELPDRKIQLKVINEDKPYTLRIEKHHVADPYYPSFIADVTFDIKITEEFGQTLELTETTNEDGIIEIEGLNGYGRIKVEIKEKSAPDKYQVDYETKYLEFNRDRDSKEAEEYDSNVHYDLNKPECDVITMMPTNEIVSGIYDMVINKVDKGNNIIITKNSAEFNLYMIREYHNNGEVTEIREPIIQNGLTDDLGMLVKEEIPMPTEAGIYVYELEEVKAPVGYEGLKEPARYQVTIAPNEDGELIITEVKPLKENSNLNVLVWKDQFISLAVLNESTLPDGMVSFDITKVDEEGNKIISDTAVFKVIDNQTNEIYYMETNENALAAQLIAKPEEVGSYSYTINEIKAPEGYALDRSDINVTLDYLEKDNGEIYLNNVTVEGTNVTYITAEDGTLPSDRIEISVTNILGSNGNANDKPYTVIINKKDADTKEMILDRTTFDVSLVNGEIVHAATNTDGQIIIENVYMPSTPGEYEMVVKELVAPENYELDSEMKIVKVTFDGTGDNMVISSMDLDSTYNNNIEIVISKCTEDKIVIDIFNESNDLYVVSKIDDNGEVIYNVLNSFAGQHYTIDNPFIDTKIVKFGANATVQEFIDNLDSNGVMTVWDKDGNQMDPTDRITTGFILKSTKGNKELAFTIVVKGDSFDDGKARVTGKDISTLLNHLTDDTKIITDPIKLRALDIQEADGLGRVIGNDLGEFYRISTE